MPSSAGVPMKRQNISKGDLVAIFVVNNIPKFYSSYKYCLLIGSVSQDFE